MNRLEAYRAKRDFGRTPEPGAEIAEVAADRLSFVVQKHDATRLHFDFRLEWKGALWSWAVTKGPSADPSEKRLAVRTEDHPLSYADFEGTIPKGEYGGGTVMLWDQGWWEPDGDPEKGLAAGKLSFRLHGARLVGGWSLVRLRGKEKRENWLLIKRDDEAAGRSPDALVNRYRTSVVTGRSMREIAADKDAAAPRAQSGARPRFRKPQLATLRDAPPEGDGWVHELKYDGYRCLIAVGKGGPRLYTRNGKDWTDRFGPLAAAAAALPCDAALIDGEVVAGSGGGDFSALQNALKSGDRLTFYAFDLLHIDGKDLTDHPLSKRRAALEGLMAKVPPRGPIRLSPAVEGNSDEVLGAICRAGGEGVVSKLADAPYRGKRTTAWIKSKCIKRAEFVVCGFMPSDKPGRPFSSLVLGSYEGGRLVYRGRVGTGFDSGTLDTLAAALKPLRRQTPPFEEAPPPETKGAVWARPDLVAEIAYTEFTSDGHLRHPVFKGLREDKSAEEVSAQAEVAAGSATRVAGVAISSAGRAVYPGGGPTKGDIAEHYARVADRFLDHAGDRPVSFVRCPDGIEKSCFFQKHAGKGFPSGIGTLPIEESSGASEDYMFLATPRAILGAVQMGTIEFHVWGARRDRLERPDRMVFDLDPDEGLGFGTVKAAAQEVRAALSEIGLESGVMVTGGKGLHVVIPLRRTSGWDTVKGFAKTFSVALAAKSPARYTTNMSKARRKGRIFLDWLRNERGATAIAPYSLRARAGAPVAVPVSWEELGDLETANAFRIGDMEERLKRACPLTAVPARAIGAGVIEGLEAWIEGAVD